MYINCQIRFQVSEVTCIGFWHLCAEFFLDLPTDSTLSGVQFSDVLGEVTLATYI